LRWKSRPVSSALGSSRDGDGEGRLELPSSVSLPCPIMDAGPAASSFSSSSSSSSSLVFAAFCLALLFRFHFLLLLLRRLPLLLLLLVLLPPPPLALTPSSLKTANNQNPTATRHTPASPGVLIPPLPPLPPPPASLPRFVLLTLLFALKRRPFPRSITLA